MCKFNPTTMVPQRALDELSTELLLKIFGYLNVPDLCRLRQTCKRFNEVISCWDHVLLKNVTPLVTNQTNTIFSTRCLNKLTTLEKFRISQNWRSGRYKEKSLLYARKKYIPWLYLTKQSIWISRGKKVFNYRRDNNNVYVRNPIHSIWGRSKADVGNFQIKNNLLISGQRDGSMWLNSVIDKRRIFDVSNCHNSDINSVDISPNGNYIVSGSRDNCFKLWKVEYYGSQGVLEQIYCQYLEDRVWKVSILDEKPLIAVGTSGNDYQNSLFIYDMHRLAHPIELPSTNYGLGVLDIRWDGPHTIWSCGYDTYLKRWDLRTGQCEQLFSDPHASALYCLDYDYCNTIMTGTQQNGRVILWDIRQPRSVQLFFMEACKDMRSKRSSPIYSLAFDSEFLFTATDQNLNVLKFSDYDGILNDYSDCCRVY